MYASFKMSNLEDVFGVRKGETNKDYQDRVSGVLYEYIGDRYTSRLDVLMDQARNIISKVKGGTRDELNNMYMYTKKQKTRYDSTYDESVILSMFGTPTSRMFNLMMKVSKICSVLETDIQNTTRDLVHMFTRLDVLHWENVIPNNNLEGRAFSEDVREQVKEMECFKLAKSVVERVAVEKAIYQTDRSRVSALSAMSYCSYGSAFPPMKCAVWLKLALAYDNACSWILRIVAAKEFEEMVKEKCTSEISDAMEHVRTMIEDEPLIKDVYRTQYFNVQQGKKEFCKAENKKYKDMFDAFCMSKGYAKKGHKRSADEMQGEAEEFEFEDYLEGDE